MVIKLRGDSNGEETDVGGVSRLCSCCIIYHRIWLIKFKWERIPILVALQKRAAVELSLPSLTSACSLVFKAF